MPRKSAAARAVTAPAQPPNRLRAPSSLSEPERKLFDDLVGACNDKHFRSSDLPLMCRYVEASVFAEQAARELRKNGAVADGKASPWLTVQEKVFGL